MGIKVITGSSKGISPTPKELDAQQRHGVIAHRRLIAKQNLVLKC
jgi:hypothetical protein